MRFFGPCYHAAVDHISVQLSDDSLPRHYPDNEPALHITLESTVSNVEMKRALVLVLPEDASKPFNCGQLNEKMVSASRISRTRACCM